MLHRMNSYRTDVSPKKKNYCLNRHTHKISFRSVTKSRPNEKTLAETPDSYLNQNQLRMFIVIKKNNKIITPTHHDGRER